VIGSFWELDFPDFQVNFFAVIFLILQQEPNLKSAAAFHSVVHVLFLYIAAAARVVLESSVWKQFFGVFIFIFVNT